MPSKGTPSEQTTSDETPRNEDGDFEAPYEDQPSRSVYDFLYQDVRRVASFLAQFEDYGVRQAVKATGSTGRTQAVKGSATGTVGLPAVLGASANVDTTTTDETKDLAEHTFDPLWANSLRLLDYLTERDLISRDIHEAQLGSFVLVSGSLSIIDTGLLSNVFDNESLFSTFRDQIIKESMAEHDKERCKAIENDLILAGKLSKSINLFLYGMGFRVWSNLTNESLVTSAHDIAYKHGSAIIGQWSLLGIKDAYPDTNKEPTEDDPDPQPIEEIAANALPEGLLKMTAKYTNIARNFLGRPRTFYGLTPLLIFREVSG